MVAEDGGEIIAEISPGRAVAVIEHSQQNFHRNLRDTYRVLRRTLYVACGERGHVLQEDESLTIEPGLIHYAIAAGKPVWIEVESEPPWSADDDFIF